MTDDGVDTMIRRRSAATRTRSPGYSPHADTIESTVVIAMAALLERHPDRLDRALAAAPHERDRQVVAIARAHLDGNSELVDALARDHLVDYPDSLIVAWIASDAVVTIASQGPPLTRVVHSRQCCRSRCSARRGPTRRRALSVPGREDLGAAGAPRARGRCRAHRPARRRPVGRRGREHAPQHAAVEGRQAAPGARRPAGDRQRRWRLHARRRPVRGRCARGAATTAADRVARCSTPATTAAPPTCARRRCSCTAARSCRPPATATGSPRTGHASTRRG